jgi:hypothetical protein
MNNSESSAENPMQIQNHPELVRKTEGAGTGGVIFGIPAGFWSIVAF